MSCSLFRLLYISLVIITFIMSLMSLLVFVVINIPREYDNRTARNVGDFTT